MATLNFFRNSSSEDPSFYDEGPTVHSPRSIELSSNDFSNTGSIDTRLIDGHRQGVELTQIKHFDAGLVKIHAGEPGHILHRNRYGMDRNFRNEPHFEELDYFSPEEFIRAQDLDSTLEFNIITFPIITNSNDQIENYVFDGVIEPLTIRARMSFFSIDVPFEAHDVRASLMDGNTDTTWAADGIKTVRVNDQRQIVSYHDQYADGVAFAGEEGGGIEQPISNVVGFYRHEKLAIMPFVDRRFIRNVSSSLGYGTDMDTALNLMSGSTDSYIRLAINERSTTCGWDYANNISVGTDSLAFGEQVY